MMISNPGNLSKAPLRIRRIKYKRVSAPNPEYLARTLSGDRAKKVEGKSSNDNFRRKN